MDKIKKMIEFEIISILKAHKIEEYYFKIDFKKTINLLFGDLLAYEERDPAAKDLESLLLSSISFKAVMYYRVAHTLYSELDFIKIKARQISDTAKLATGIEIHPAAKIGERFVIDHGIGTVIGEEVIIGSNCYILQKVTIGSLGIADNINTSKRHPTIKNNVEIGAFSRILGNITIGNNCFIAPHCLVVQDVEDNYRVTIKGSLQMIKKAS